MEGNVSTPMKKVDNDNKTREATSTVDQPAVNVDQSARSRRLASRGGFLCVAALVGALAGFGAFILKSLIGLISKVATSGFDAVSGNWLLLVLPAGGIFLTVAFTRYVLHADIEHGTERIIKALKTKAYKMKGYLTFAPIAASSITIGLGGSAGSEGPIAYTGAAIGSNIGRWLKLSPRMMAIMIGCGAGAGIAGIFKAPLGGALFTLEVVGLQLETFAVIGLIVACVVAAGVAYVCSGCTLDVVYLPTTPFEPWTIWAVALLGVACGLYSLYYSFLMEKIEIFLNSIKTQWVKNLIAGATLAGLVFLFPVLYGEGYGTVDKLINNDSATLLNDSLFFDSTSPLAIIAFVACALAVKAVATQSTNSGGGVGGDFAPTLFAGALAGFLFGYVANIALGARLPIANFALFGMAGVMAGAIQAPLMAIFLVSEMSGDYGMLFPLGVAAIVSYAVTKLFSRHVRKSRPAWRHFNSNRR